MIVFFDTSVLVAAIIEGHEHHARAWPWLERALEGRFTWAMAAHSLAETYATATRMPSGLRINPMRLFHILQENVTQSAVVVTLDPEDYWATLGELAQTGIIGGAIYDALIARAAQKARANRLLTFNVEHFRRVWPDGDKIITAP